MNDTRNSVRHASENILRRLARSAAGLSGADIERHIREVRQSARRGRRGLTWSDLEAKLAGSNPPRPEDLRWRIALHEAGHVIARLVLGLGRVTLISIDRAAGGVMISENPQTAETEQLLSSYLVAQLSGRAAEQEFLGAFVAGSGGQSDSDLGKATDLALRMEVALGFGKQMPLLYRSPETHASLLFYEPEVIRNVNARLEEAFGRARKIVAQHRDIIQTLASALMVHDTIEGPELDTVLEAIKHRMAPGRADF